MLKEIHVAIGVIVDSNQQILVAKRPAHADQGDLWEFPGGKVETNEDVYAALCRELKEELNLEVLSAEPFLKVTYDYSDYSVLLDVWRVEKFQGEIFGAEGQPIRWVSLQELQALPILAGSEKIIAALKKGFPLLRERAGERGLN